MASQYDPRKEAEFEVCSNAPDPQTLRTSQTLQEEISPTQKTKSGEISSKGTVVFSGLQVRFG